jgi:plastocyanin
MSRNKYLLLLALCGALMGTVACGGGEEEQASSEAPAASAPEAGTDVANAGTISGTINYTGPDPDTAIAMNADPNCAALHQQTVETEKVVANDGKLANVFVYVKTGLEGKTFPTPTEKKVLDQKGCQYFPHVQGIQVGQPLEIKNSDATLHNIHALPASNQEFNQSQPFQDQKFDKVFDKPEIMVPIKCDVHPWMNGYVGVVSHPYYAVSSEDGTFKIEKLPPGNYTIEAWHEELGTQTQQVTVDPNGTATMDLTFQPKA